MVRLVIPGRLPGLNEVNNENRRNKYAGSQLKKDTDQIISLYVKKQLQAKYERIKISFEWYEPNKRRDFDNISSAKKFILDSLVKNGVIPNDGWKQIYPEFTDKFYYDKDNPRVEVTIEEW